MILSCDETCSAVKLKIRDVGSPELLAEPCLIPEVGSLAISFRSDRWIRSTSRLKARRATNMFDPHHACSSPVALLLYELELLNGSSGALRVMDLKHCASARTPGHLSGHLGLPNGL